MHEAMVMNQKKERTCAPGDCLASANVGHTPLLDVLTSHQQAEEVVRFTTTAFFQSRFPYCDHF